MHLVDSECENLRVRALFLVRVGPERFRFGTAHCFDRPHMDSAQKPAPSGVDPQEFHSASRLFHLMGGQSNAHTDGARYAQIEDLRRYI